jgi:hypothetical protein
VILLFVKKSTLDFKTFNPNLMTASHPMKIDSIELIKPEELERIKKVGIKNGMKKDYIQPDMLKIPKAQPKGMPSLSLGNLSPDLPAPKQNKENIADKKSTYNPLTRPTDDSTGHIYFNPKKEKKIYSNRDQDNLKQEVYKNVPVSTNNPIAQKMSNFEIRYERPEGVSEDELNSDEKAYYSFFKRSYANYLTKLYAAYEKISVERPGLEKDFGNKHLLIGRIDYDDKGNIILVKILKSSESDDVHYFFEETLKQLNLPNPPKSFIKSKKQFSTYYQIQIN